MLAVATIKHVLPRTAKKCRVVRSARVLTAKHQRLFFPFFSGDEKNCLPVRKYVLYLQQRYELTALISHPILLNLLNLIVKPKHSKVEFRWYTLLWLLRKKMRRTYRVSGKAPCEVLGLSESESTRSCSPASVLSVDKQVYLKMIYFVRMHPRPLFSCLGGRGSSICWLPRVPDLRKDGMCAGSSGDAVPISEVSVLSRPVTMCAAFLQPASTKLWITAPFYFTQLIIQLGMLRALIEAKKRTQYFLTKHSIDGSSFFW